jgi:NAD(P)-dependent dehydrogenase (short-subunit alcohol dehydrogenase family)
VSTILVTGATAGLGAWLAHRLAGGGHTVLAHGRDPAKVGELAELANVIPFVADLASLADVRRLAAEVAALGPLDVLVNNAGVGFGRPGAPRELSKDGHELRWAVNYLAPVLLARELLPALRAAAPARIVNVGSLGQVPIDFDDLEMERRYDGVDAYRRAKLALAAFTFDLADEQSESGSGVTVTCLHPATFMDTAMVNEYGAAPLSTVDEGGEATLALVTGPQHATTNGEFFDGRNPARANPAAYDPEVRRRLREVTDSALA